MEFFIYWVKDVVEILKGGRIIKIVWVATGDCFIEKRKCACAYFVCGCRSYDSVFNLGNKLMFRCMYYSLFSNGLIVIRVGGELGGGGGSVE